MQSQASAQFRTAGRPGSCLQSCARATVSWSSPLVIDQGAGPPCPARKDIKRPRDQRPLRSPAAEPLRSTVLGSQKTKDAFAAQGISPDYAREVAGVAYLVGF